jgi:hypothetical protein
MPRTAVEIEDGSRTLSMVVDQGSRQLD